MKRREFLVAVALCGLAARSSAQSHRPKVGYFLLPPLSETPTRERQAFLEGLREFGYVVGTTIDIVYRSAQNEPDFLEDVCQELIGQKVDIIVVSGAVATLAAKKTTRTVPIVMQAVGDPVGIGAVHSLSRPEGNLTGVSFISSELAGKRLQLVRDVLPGVKRIAVLWNMRNANAVAESRATLDAAQTLGITPEPLPVGSNTQLQNTLDRVRSSKSDALYVTFEGGLIAGNRTLIAEYALQHKIPLVSGWSFLTEAGGLMSYAPDIPTMFRRSASFVDRILKGAKPSDLPIELATTVELVLNRKTAKALGIVFPPSILVRADRVIE